MNYVSDYIWDRSGIMQEKVLIAHINEENQIQTLKEHSENTAWLCETFLNNTGLRNIGRLCGLVHDLAKSKSAFQNYIKFDEVKKIDHSTGGGLYLSEIKEEFIQTNEKSKSVAKMTTQLLMMSVFCHHSGLKNVISYTGEFDYGKRLNCDKNKIDYDESIENFNKYCISEENIKSLYTLSVKEIVCFLNQIQTFSKCRSDSDFYFGLLQRLIFSTLIDADKYDTYCFFSNITPQCEINRNSTWKILCQRLEDHLVTLHSESEINRLRNKISDECRSSATGKSGVYRLLAPTGSGKTMASLRFALHHAIKNKKIRHIYYVIPYLSILTQNAKTLRDILQEKNEDIILEHYSDIVFDDEENEKHHKFLTERADNAMIVTSYVQLLNTLFDGSKQSARRMHQLTDSIIIFDEIQSLPVSCTSLFNSAMNFLANTCNSTIVLCSATQPVLSKVKKPIELHADILKDSEYYLEKFRRTKIIDKTNKAMSIQEIATFAIDKLTDVDSELLVMNTKKEVSELYREIKNNVESVVKVFYLSTNLCPAHKADVIRDIYEVLKNSTSDNHIKVICVTTPLIEAGVDLDFHMVVRACSGLDNILQAAGRCNRNGLREIGYVYIIEVENENLNNLKDTKIKKTCTMSVLNNIRKNPVDYHNGDILSSEALNEYYNIYYDKLKELQDYPYDEFGRKGDLYDLLTANKHGKQAYEEMEGSVNLKDYPLKQAFQDAGRIFKVIEEKTTAVLVEYGEGIQIISSLLSRNIDYKEINILLKQAQRYSINLYENQIRILGNDIQKIEDLDVWILKAKNYNSEFCLNIDGEAEMYAF